MSWEEYDGLEFGDARVGAEKEKYGILGKTVKIIKIPLARHNPGHELEAFFTPQQKNNPQNLGIFGLESTFHYQKLCKFPFRVQVQGGVAAN